jgi:hypothetical protein
MSDAGNPQVRRRRPCEISTSSPPPRRRPFPYMSWPRSLGRRRHPRSPRRSILGKRNTGALFPAAAPLASPLIEDGARRPLRTRRSPRYSQWSGCVMWRSSRRGARAGSARRWRMRLEEADDVRRRPRMIRWSKASPARRLLPRRSFAVVVLAIQTVVDCELDRNSSLATRRGSACSSRRIGVQRRGGHNNQVASARAGAGKVCLGSGRLPGGQHWVTERVPAL